MGNKILILDRDGVINEDRERGITDPRDWNALPGSLEAIAQLCRAEYRVVIITNQSGIARGYYSINTLNRIHQKMLDELQAVGGEVSAIFFCPHRDEDNCECRKPKPGMFLELAERLQCDLRDTFAVGDSFRDMEAARAAGAQPVLVKTGNGEKTIDELADAKIKNIPVHADLKTFVDTLPTADD